MSLPLADLIAFQYPQAIPLRDYVVEDVDGHGVYTIGRWNVATLGPQPDETFFAGLAQSPAFQSYLAAQPAREQARLLVATPGFVALLAAVNETRVALHLPVVTLDDVAKTAAVNAAQAPILTP